MDRDHDAKMALIGKLMNQYLSAQAGPEYLREVTSGLSMFTVEAVRLACRDFAMGIAGRPGFAPNGPEIFQQTQKHQRKMNAERRSMSHDVDWVAFPLGQPTPKGFRTELEAEEHRQKLFWQWLEARGVQPETAAAAALKPRFEHELEAKIEENRRLASVKQIEGGKSVAKRK